MFEALRAETRKSQGLGIEFKQWKIIWEESVSDLDIESDEEGEKNKN